MTEFVRLFWMQTALTLYCLSAVLSATVSLPDTPNIAHSDAVNVHPNPTKLEKRTSTTNSAKKAATPVAEPKTKADHDLYTEESVRHHKMLDYYGYFQQPLVQAYPTPFYPQNFYEDFNNIDDEDLMSRGNRRKPGSATQNSPIFYIRLPPTPYMFVPGMGYISQPPTIQPIATQYPLPPPQPIHPMPMNPFINLPVNFLSNGKPTSVYQWGGAPPGLHGSFGPQYPSYLPARPQRPTYRPQKPYLPDSKITHLKGPFVFNGRPEDIYVLPNSPYSNPFSSPYSNDYSQSAALPPGYSNPAFNHLSYNTPYNAPFNSIYSDPMSSYY